MTGGEGRSGTGTPVRKISFPGHGGSPVLPEVNLVLLGNLGVGKSALTVKYLTKKFINEYDPELEDIYSRIDILEGQEVVVNVMDTCDKANKDAERYLRWANVFLIVYDLTNRASFDQAVQEHLQPLAFQQRARRSNTDTALFLVANKMDLESYRQVSQAEGRCCANKYDSLFYETTAAEEYEEASRVFHEAVRVGLQELERSSRFCQRHYPEERSIANRVVYPRLLDRIPLHGRFNKEHRRNDDKTASDRGPKFKIFNKGFKIFQS